MGLRSQPSSNLRRKPHRIPHRKASVLLRHRPPCPIHIHLHPGLYNLQNLLKTLCFCPYLVSECVVVHEFESLAYQKPFPVAAMTAAAMFR